MTRILIALAAALAVAVGGAGAAGTKAWPDTIRLPDGFQPEGIAISGKTFYVGSIPTGAVYRGDLRTGRGAVLVQGVTGRAAIGIKVRRGLIFLAGGPTGKAFVYNARTGAPVATYTLTTGTTFVNDVAVTGNAAWFTDSVNPVLYRVQLAAAGRPGPEVETIRLTGDLQYVAGFNVNGIDATTSRLILVQSNTGKLFTSTFAGVTDEIALGGTTLVNGDGILLSGRILYVVQNRNNRIARVALNGRLTSGRVTGFITDPDFDVPTTVDDSGRRLYAVNARFGTTGANTRYDVVQVRKR
jgi:outer membrane protein assembly factor BamB